jgi:hypothetical protein
MRNDTTFRSSLYLTLGLSCLCVGYAERDLLPEVAWIMCVVLLALALIYRLETRVQLLSIPAANRLGFVLGLLNFTWAAVRITREARNPELETVSWQVMLVALFGPLLMMLMPAKLARRERLPGDYWGLHTLGLVGVCLSGAMVEDAVSFFLIVMYAVCALWNLCLFHVRNAGGAFDSIAPVPGRVVSVIEGRPAGRILLQAARATALAAALAIPFYLVTPRSPAEKLSLGKARIEIGYAADQMTNLNQTGDLKPNEQLAFEVTAEVNGHPKLDLPSDQRWRGRVMRVYASGTWTAGDRAMLPTIDPEPSRGMVWSPPRLGPDQFTLTFDVPRLGNGFLADPVLWAGDQPPPVASITREGYRPWVSVGDGSFFPNNPQGESRRGERLRYVQVWREPEDRDLGPPFRIADAEPERKLHHLLISPVTGVKEYADALLTRLIQNKMLPANCRNPITLRPRPEYHDQIARAFSAHLATSPEFVYTTSLRRPNRRLDPVDEFLNHTRAGHCERFASALALMLRSQGIPTVMVLGFKGCESSAEAGKYLVQERFAHAWVEALIREFAPPPAPGLEPISRWRSLDPTPSGSTGTTEQAAGEWMGQTTSWFRKFYRDYLSEYNAVRRQQLLAAAADAATQWHTPVIILGTLIVYLGVRHLRSRKGRGGPVADSPEARWFDRLRVLLARHGFHPIEGETPREFAMRVSAALQQKSTTLELAEVPLDWVEAYYEGRFGARPLAEDRQSRLEIRLAELARALAA